MRLTQILAVWPRKRPNGHIWSGKHRMVEKVKENHLKAMDKNIKMEKANMHICLNPYISPEHERIAMKSREGVGLRPDQILFKMRKAKLEASIMAPTYAEDNIKHLAHNVPWKK